MRAGWGASHTSIGRIAYKYRRYRYRLKHYSAYSLGWVQQSHAANCRRPRSPCDASASPRLDISTWYVLIVSVRTMLYRVGTEALYKLLIKENLAIFWELAGFWTLFYSKHEALCYVRRGYAKPKTNFDFNNYFASCCQGVTKHGKSIM